MQAFILLFELQEESLQDRTRKIAMEPRKALLSDGEICSIVWVVTVLIAWILGTSSSQAGPSQRTV